MVGVLGCDEGDAMQLREVGYPLKPDIFFGIIVMRHHQGHFNALL